MPHGNPLGPTSHRVSGKPTNPGGPGWRPGGTGRSFRTSTSSRGVLSDAANIQRQLRGLLPAPQALPSLPLVPGVPTAVLPETRGTRRCCRARRGGEGGCPAPEGSAWGLARRAREGSAEDNGCGAPRSRGGKGGTAPRAGTARPRGEGSGRGGRARGAREGGSRSAPPAAPSPPPRTPTAAPSPQRFLTGRTALPGPAPLRQPGGHFPSAGGTDAGPAGRGKGHHRALRASLPPGAGTPHPAPSERHLGFG